MATLFSPYKDSLDFQEEDMFMEFEADEDTMFMNFTAQIYDDSVYEETEWFNVTFKHFNQRHHNSAFRTRTGRLPDVQIVILDDEGE